MKVVFLGTPQFAVLPLQAIAKSAHKVVAVVCQPDRAKNRKGEFIFSPVKNAATQLNIPVFQFENINQNVDILKSLDADIFITAAYGQILSQNVIDIPKYGIINAHSSLLPLLRGASPIQSALLLGHDKTGVTIMQTEAGLDCGDIILSKQINILDSDDILTLTQSLSEMAADLLVSALDLIESGQAKPTVQDHARATKCTLIKTSAGNLDFNECATDLFNKIRAIDCFAFINGVRIKILKSEVVEACHKPEMGQVGTFDSDFVVFCGRGLLKITKVLPQNKSQMSGKEYLIGHRGKKFD